MIIVSDPWLNLAICAFFGALGGAIVTLIMRMDDVMFLIDDWRERRKQKRGKYDL